MPQNDKLTAEAVLEVVQYCAVPEKKFQELREYAPERCYEVVLEAGAYYLARGIFGRIYIFDAAKLKERHNDILSLIAQLPDSCETDRGAEFHDCRQDKNHEDWGGGDEHVDGLLALGRVIYKVSLLPPSQGNAGLLRVIVHT